MAYKCNKCGNIAAEVTWTGRIKAGTCVRCGAKEQGDVISVGAKGINIDWSLIPYRLVKNFDWEKLKSGDISYYKLSTVIVGPHKSGYNKVVLHVPITDEALRKKFHSKTELLIIDPPFKPYYFVNEKDYLENQVAADTILHEHNGTIEEKSTMLGTDREPVRRVEFKNDECRKMSTFRLDKVNVRTYESVVPLTRRINIDLGLKSSDLPTKLYYDIEVDTRNIQTGEGYITAASITSCNNRIILICAKDETGKEWSFVLEEETDEAEKKLIRNFLKLISQYSTSCGYYSGRFDVPYVQARADVLGISWNFEFVSAMDMHNIYTVMNLSTYDATKFDLDTVGLKEFGIGKMEFEDYDELYEWFIHDRQRLVNYCKRDVDIVKRLDEKFDAINSRKFVCSLTYVRPDAYVTYMEGIESIIMRRLLIRTPRVALRTKWVKKRKTSLSYSGALVVDPVPGTHEWVLVLDFKSMYNRIMQTFNIGIDTLDPNGEIITPKARFTNKIKSVFAESLDELEAYRNSEVKIRDTYPLYSEGWWMYDRRQWLIKYYLVSYYGVTGATDSRVYNPEVAESITLTGQDCLKRAKEEAEKLGFPVIYGDTDSIFVKCPMKIGDLEGTLELGNKLCKIIAQKINDHAVESYHVTNPKISIEVDKVFTKLYLPDVKKRYAGWMMWKGTIVNPQFECSRCGERTKATSLLSVPEKDSNLFLIWAKTIDRVCDVVETIGCVCPKCASSLQKDPKLYLYVAGFEAKRRDWTTYAKNLQLRLFEMFLDGLNKDYIKDWIRGYVIELYNGKHDMEISFVKPIRRRLVDYHANAPHIKAARKWEERTGKKLRLAQYVTYYVMDNEGTVFPLIHENEVVKLPKTAYNFIFMHQLNGILDRLGFSKDEILSLRSAELLREKDQMSLSSFV